MIEILKRLVHKSSWVMKSWNVYLLHMSPICFSSKPPSFHTKGMHKWFDFVFYAADSLRPTKTRKNCISWNEFRFFPTSGRSRRNLFDAKESTRLGQDILIPGPSSLGANKEPWRMVNWHPVTQPLAPKLEGAGMQTSANMMGQNDEYPPVN